MSLASIIAEVQKLAIENWGWILIIGYICASLIEISPIKIYPIKYIKTKFLQWLNHLVKEVNNESFEKVSEDIKAITTEISDIKKELSESIREQKKDKIKRLRKEILAFADDLVGGKKEFSKKSYEEVLFSTYPEYENLIESMGETNGFVDSSIAFIKEKYEQHLRDGDFILDNEESC